MKHFICLLLAGLTLCTSLVKAQQTETKYYTNVWGGQVDMVYNWGELRSATAADKVFTVSARTSDYYYLRALANRMTGEKLKLVVNGVSIEVLYPETDGWQWIGKGIYIKLLKGKNEIRFMGTSLAVPMVEEISLTYYNPWARTAPATAGDRFVETMEALKQQPAGRFKSAAEAGDMTNKVLPNPKGTYNHAIDTQFSYSHFSWIYLNAGSHNFETSGSTIDRALTIFNPADYTYSWSNVNGGPGGESSLPLYISQPGYYAIMLRSVTDGQTGTTNIIYNGNPLTLNATIGGRRLAMSSLRGGNLNFFTCKLSGSMADTRLLVSRYAMSSARAYNDDYSGGGGDWIWGLASRIKKNMIGPDSVQYGYVCAYSPSSTGIADIYLGLGNSGLDELEPWNFPLLKNDDALETAPWDGVYNCISWSGGITTSWSWPPNSLSTYNCNGAPTVQCFDNFYNNNPVRYPGAWNYTRSGATVSNSVVDLWKRPAGEYQHASVRKPGNNHPHGYDWESKPGGTWRTLHPRHALTQANWYGVVNDYYRPTGTYARTAISSEFYATDMDAVKAGVAVLDVASLTRGAQDKLGKLMQQVDPAYTRQFNELYAAWHKTKAANATLSDPAMYCKNKEHEALAALGKTNHFACLVLVMDKFVNSNDHFMGELLVALSKEKYGHLLDEVKQERLAKPTDEQGRHKIHGDHDNGVLYIEKILAALNGSSDVKPVAETITVTASPNPVKDRLTVTVTLGSTARVSVKATSAQTRNSKMIQQEKLLPAGTYQFSLGTTGLAGGTGDILTIQVTVNDTVKTVKVLVG